MHELHDENGLSDSCAPEETRLSTPDEGKEKIDRLDSGLERALSRGRLIEGRRLAENAPEFFGGKGRAPVEGVSEQVDQTAEAGGSDRDLDGPPRIEDLQAATEAARTVKNNGAEMRRVEVLMHFEDVPVFFRGHDQRLPERGQNLAGNGDDGPVDLRDLSDNRWRLACHHSSRRDGTRRIFGVERTGAERLSLRYSESGSLPVARSGPRPGNGSLQKRGIENGKTGRK
jgi:hypothetical protein